MKIKNERNKLTFINKLEEDMSFFINENIV